MSISRRSFLIRSGATAAGLSAGLAGLQSLLGHAAAPRAELPARPHIVIILTDQERTPQHWPTDWADANLPNRKRLMDTGISFSHAFCNTCMCSPSRSTLLTGLYPARHGVVDTLTLGQRYSETEQVLPLDIQNIAKLLRSVGYAVVYKGKWHLSKPLNGVEWTSADSAAVARYGFNGWNPPDAGEDTAPEHFGGGIANNDERITDDAVAFLAGVDAQQPFALIVSLVNPHDVLSFPNSYQGNYDPAVFADQGIDLPPTSGEDLSTKPSCQAAILAQLDNGLGALPTVADQLAYVNFYAYLHQVVDQQIGRIIDAIEAPRGGSGAEPSLRQTTVIIRAADHGEMGLAHGGLRQKAFNVYEETIRVPLVFSNPSLAPLARTSDALVSLIDVMPTLATLAGVERAAWEFQGVDLTPILTGTAQTVQAAIHFTFDDQRAGFGNLPSAVPQPNHIRCIREAGWKYAIYFDPNGRQPNQYELYDLVNDPLETNNLAQSSDLAIQKLRSELQQRVVAQMTTAQTLPFALALPLITQ